MVNGSIGKILVVDDEVELKNVLVEALTSQGYETEGFTSGEEALAVLRGKTFDVLLTDLMMPGMDGITLVRESLQIDPHIVCMMMTGQGTIQTAVDAMKEGAFDYVLKPFRLQTVLPVLTRAMNTRHMRLENLQLRETVAIYELGQTIAFTLDPQTVVSKLADAALQQTDADEVSVLLPTADGDHLYVAAVRGKNRQRLLGERVPLDESISGWVAREREPLILDGAVNDKRFRSMWPNPEIRSAISIPMQVANKLVGTININALDRARPFTIGQMKALTILAGTAAAALESASLYGQVQKAEENYRSIFENAIEGIFRATPDAVRFVSVNPAMAQMFGYESPAEMVQSVVDVTQQLGLDPARRDEALDLLSKQGVLENFEALVQRKDGSEIWTSANVRAVFGAADELLCLDGIVQDITPRRHAEKEQARLTAILQATTDMVATADLKGFVQYINQAGRNMLGLGEEQDVTNTRIADYHDEWAASIVMNVGIPAAIESGFWSGETALLSHDGREIPLSQVIIAHRAPDGSVEYLSTIGRDITERKRAEAEILTEQLFSESIVKSLPGIFYLFDQSGKFLRWNKNFEQITGYSAEEIAALSPLDLFAGPEKELIAQRIQEVFASGAADAEAHLVSKSGQRTAYYFTGVLINLNDQPCLIGVGLDITERKQAEEALQASERKFREIFTLAPVGIYQSLRDGTLITANQALAGMLGYDSGKELLEVNLARVYLTEDDRDRLIAEYEDRGYATDLELQWQRKDGTPIWVQLTAHAIKGTDGMAEYFEGFVRDITERKQAEDALAESEARYRALVESLPAMIYYVQADPPYSPLFLNSNIEALGYSNDEWYSKPDLWVSMLHPDDREWVLRKTEAAKIAGANTEFEYRVVAKNGSILWLHDRGRFFTDPSGARTWQGVILDITERKQAEESLRGSEERYRDLVENAHDIIYSHDLNGKFTSLNKAGEMITGYTHEEAMALDLTRTVAPDYLSEAQEMIRKKIAGEKVTAYELEIIAKDGHRIRVEASTKLVFQNGVPVGVQGIARDVTERKHLEDQLRQSQKLEAIGQLAGGIAHDFNNLLTAINGYSSLALQRIEGNAAVKSYLEEIRKAGDRAANLTRQLLAFGRKQILQPLPLDLNDTVTDMNKMLRRLIGEDIELSAKLAADLKRVTADPGQIEQVLVNLVVNARDAMPQGGKLTIETANTELDREYASEHAGVHPGAYVVLAVSDTGTGMDEEVKRHIFEPFFTTKEKGKGTGLGLSTVYGIVKQSGGNISIYSEPNHGTTFKVYLPAVDSDPNSTEVKAEESAIAGGSETVLLVEDEEVVRGLACQILEDAGYRVLVAPQGEDAIRMGNEHAKEIHLLLTDVVMPGAGGKEVADHLSAVCPGIKVLFMSGYTDEAIVHHGMLDSNVKFIQKPFTPAGLARKVREVLDSNGKKSPDRPKRA